MNEEAVRRLYDASSRQSGDGVSGCIRHADGREIRFTRLMSVHAPSGDFFILETGEGSQRIAPEQIEGVELDGSAA